MRRPRRQTLTLLPLAMALVTACGSSGASTSTPDAAQLADRRLDSALRAFVHRTDGPPAIAVVVQRGTHAPVLHSFGTAVVGSSQPVRLGDHVRVASVAKAFSGATALATVKSGRLELSSTVGAVLPTLPSAWHPVTLTQLLQHTSGIPDFSKSPAFRDALTASLQTAPTPAALLAYAGDALSFPPGSKYEYSNSDNVVAALMVEATTGQSYETALANSVTTPFGLSETTLPSDSAMPTPTVHGYDLDPPKPPDDVTNLYAAGWTFASGGVVSTPADANRFVRAYARGDETDPSSHRAQFRFVAGHSEPPGPGANTAGLAIFRYRTRCGTVYGHTGNTPGYTQFIAASPDGKRSTSVSINAQITPSTNAVGFRTLRHIFELAVCASTA